MKGGNIMFKTGALLTFSLILSGVLIYIIIELNRGTFDNSSHSTVSSDVDYIISIMG